MLHTKAEQLEVLLICISQDLLKLGNLTDAALPRNDGPDCVLNRRLLSLKVLDLLDHYRSILLWLQPIDTIEEHGPVIVRNEVSLPSGEKLILQIVNDVT